MNDSDRRSLLRHRVRPGPLQRPRWAAVAFVAVTFAAALVFSLSCQRSQIRISKDQAITIALRQVDFQPTRTQIRFVRQGLQGAPYWAVSLSKPSPNGRVYLRLAVIQLNANTGDVTKVIREKDVLVEGGTQSPQTSGQQEESKP